MTDLVELWLTDSQPAETLQEFHSRYLEKREKREREVRALVQGVYPVVSALGPVGVVGGIVGAVLGVALFPRLGGRLK